MGQNVPTPRGSVHEIAQAHSEPARQIGHEQKMLEATTPFPWKPVVAIAVCLVAHDYALCNLFPYAGYMVRYLGATDDKDEAGYYAGYLSSALMVGHFASSYAWGRLADRRGRLPVMYSGLFFIAALSVAFGFSTNFYWAVFIRFATGALNGIVANCKTMISEVCGREHEVVGMSFITGCWSVGLVLGAGLGGLLAEPADHFPTMFSQSGLFGRFPYLLPNVLGAGLCLAGIVLVYFFLEETVDVQNGSGRRGGEPSPTAAVELPIQEAAVDKGEVVRTTFREIDYPELPHGDGGGATYWDGGKHELETKRGKGSDARSAWARAVEKLPLAPEPLTSSSGVETRVEEEGSIAYIRACLLPFKILGEKRVRTVLFGYVLFSFISVGTQEVYPLWALSTVANGGLSWTTKQIGQALSVCGGAMLVFQLFIYPWIVTQIGPTRSQRWSCCVSIPVFLSYPLLSKLRDDPGAVLLGASVAVLFLTSVASNAVVINVSLALNNAVQPSQRGTINGITVTLVSVAKASGPIISSTIFAWSISSQRPFPLDFHFVFCFFAVCMVVVTAISWNIDISPVKSGQNSGDASPAVAGEDSSLGWRNESDLSNKDLV